MGVVNTINYEKFPKQGDLLHKRVQVVYEYDTSKCHEGTVVRYDVEEPFKVIFKLDNGRVLLGTECQYRPL